jgi:hypothetical protein
VSIVTELIEYGQRDLADADKDALALIAAGDVDRAVVVIGEAAEVAEGLKRQERALEDSGP